jgi:hypothetical protein
MDNDIIRMAREAGLYGNGYFESTPCPELEHFTALVRADERERIKTANAPEIEKVNSYIKELETAAQQALEALEADCGGRCNAEYNPCWQREVSETLRAALAQQAEPTKSSEEA